MMERRKGKAAEAKSKSKMLTHAQVIALLRKVRRALVPIEDRGKLARAIRDIGCCIRTGATEAEMVGYSREDGLRAWLRGILPLLRAWTGPEARAAKAALSAYTMVGFLRRRR